MKVVYYPDPILQKISQPVEKIDQRLEAFIDDMFNTMFRYKGCGLAAPQVGVSKQIIVYTSSGDSKECQVLINPKIIAQEESQTDKEGCLSFPEIIGLVKRWRCITVETLTLSGELKTFDAENFHARVIQHEMDHLKGVLFTERMEPQDIKNAEIALKKLKKAYPDPSSEKKRPFALI